MNLSAHSESYLLEALQNLLRHKQFLTNGKPSAFSFLNLQSTDAESDHIQDRTIFVSSSFLAGILQHFSQGLTPFEIVTIYDRKLDNFLKAWLYRLGNPTLELPPSFNFHGSVFMDSPEAVMDSLSKDDLLGVLGEGRSLSKHITEYLNTDDLQTRKWLMKHTLPSLALKRRFKPHDVEQKKEQVTDELSSAFTKAWLGWVKEEPATRSLLSEGMRKYLIHHPALYALWPHSSLLEKKLGEQDLFQIQTPEVLIAHLKNTSSYVPVYNRYSKKELLLYYAESRPEFLLLMLHHFEAQQTSPDFDYLSLLAGLSRYKKTDGHCDETWVRAVEHVKTKVSFSDLKPVFMDELTQVLSRKKMMESNSSFLAWTKLVLFNALKTPLAKTLNNPQTILALFEQAIASKDSIEDMLTRFDLLKEFGLTLQSTKTKYASFYEVLYLKMVLVSEQSLERAYRMLCLFGEDISGDFSNGKPLFKQPVFLSSSPDVLTIENVFSLTYIKNDMLNIHLKETIKPIQNPRTATIAKPTYDRF